jgi:type I restriction enzyme, S subunit
MYEVKKLLSVCDIVKQRPKQYEGYKQYVATGDLKSSEIVSSTEFTFEGRPSRADCTVRTGDVLFAKMAGTEKTLVAGKHHEDMIFSTGFAVLRPIGGDLDSRYLYHYLRSHRFLSEKDRLSSGATQKAITNKSLERITITFHQ